jgi:hypothetical protein
MPNQAIAVKRCSGRWHAALPPVAGLGLDPVDEIVA